jgi:hypothetical protein
MSWSIPTKIEEDIISGKAQYRTFQTGAGGQSILPVPSNAYAVIFGYDFSPAGGGITFSAVVPVSGTYQEETFARWFQTQQISFYTGADFYPFIHHINSTQSTFVNTFNPATGATTLVNTVLSLDNTPIARQIYITSDKDVTISVGCVLNSPQASANAIPQTNRTPALLTYGGSGQVGSTQTNFGPAATPIQFMQPSPKDYQAFGFGLLPNGASGQAFATPDPTNGLIDPSVLLNSLSANIRNAASSNYFLNLHYALYTESVPEQRG